MERRLTAIFAADVVGYSRLMGLDEAGTLSALKTHRREMADAKARLVSNLEAQNVRLTRERPEWMAELDVTERTRLAVLVRALSEASILNARVLQRHIDLSTDMMAAVAAEAQRLTGARGATYGAGGMLARSDQATPISLNARL